MVSMARETEDKWVNLKLRSPCGRKANEAMYKDEV